MTSKPMRSGGGRTGAKAVAVPVDVRLTSLLPGCSFADAYCVVLAAAALDARQAAQAVLDSPPRWVNALLAVRNRAVRPFGLKAAVRQARPDAPGQIGIFPVRAESPAELVLGFDDGHLDFRVVVAVQPAQAGGSRVTLTTLVRTNNRLGRVYLAVILPFHRLVVRGMLQGAARRLER